MGRNRDSFLSQRGLGMRDRKIVAAVCGGATVGLIWLAGCGPRRVADATFATAQGAWDRASQSLDAGELAVALEALDLALAAGAGLHADLYVDALLMRSVCLAAVRRWEDAAVDLEMAAEGATDWDQVCIARAALARSRGEPLEAERELAEARKLNPKATDTPLWRAAMSVGLGSP